MTLQFIGTDSDGFTPAGNGDMVVVVASGRLSIQGFGDAFDFAGLSSVSLVVLGSIFSEDGDAVSSDGGSSALKVTVDPGGSITGASDGIELNGNSHVVINHGLVQGLSDAAVQMLGASSKVTNFGTMAASRGVIMDAADGQVVNHGLIHGVTSVGVSLSTGGSLLNTGIITSAAVAVVMSGPEGTLRNSGEISSLGANAFSGSTGIDVVQNSGLIAGDVALGDGADLLRNNGGRIVGDVDTGAVADKVLNRDGSIDGDLLLDDGNDLYRGGKGSTVEGRILAGEGNDTVIGGDGEDVVEGGGGFDRLFGKAGDDVLKGGSGEDLIVGGGGDDEMTGGSQADVFRIGRHSGDDLITDWTDGEDVLNLRALNIDITTSVGDVKAASQNRAGGVVIIDLDALGGDGSLEITGWNVNLMGSSDFIF
ncbi:hypothetical protein P2H44_19795 [Albimonas sp. CAU 1670]|uniref:calcium-binding protein n=1 Tax=Albimonas sp. CAU 1670 TaxID=3032599 RepID=UPI0023DC9004|nr:hypothetical protein [Albimonas sp. CAU 1670]MDF2234810.1 hypothetical protein [Albimonas sp. CAU 1670]